MQTGIWPVTVKVPQVRAKNSKPVTFRSALVSPYVRKAKCLEAALPWLYLKGISTGKMGSALKMLLGYRLLNFHPARSGALWVDTSIGAGGATDRCAELSSGAARLSVAVNINKPSSDKKRMHYLRQLYTRLASILLLGFAAFQAP